MLYFLDTNVFTEGWRRGGDRKVEQWIESNDWLVPVVVIAEIQEGAESSNRASERARINGRLDAFLKEHSLYVVDWDTETARTWGRLQFSHVTKRQPQALWDSLIDAMAVRHGATVATRNQKDFRHAPTMNPWQDA